MRRYKFRVVLTGGVLLALTSVSGCGSSWPESDMVRIGVKVDQPGTGYAEGGYPPHTGFDIRIGEMAAKALGKKADFKSVESVDRQVSLDGKHPYDLVIATYSINNERLTGSNNLPAHDFVGPYAITYQGFMVREGSPEVTSLDGLKGKKVCTWGGTTSKSVIDANLKSTGIVPVGRRTATKCIEALEADKVDAVSTDQLILYGFSEVYKGLKVVPDVTIGDAQYYGIGLPKGHRKECKELRGALMEYVSSRDWASDFSGQLGSAVKAQPGKWEASYKPGGKLIESLSCRDKVE